MLSRIEPNYLCSFATRPTGSTCLKDAHLLVHVGQGALIAALTGYHALRVFIAQRQRRRAAAVAPGDAAPPAQTRLRLNLRSPMLPLSADIALQLWHHSICCHHDYGIATGTICCEPLRLLPYLLRLLPACAGALQSA